MRYVLGVLTLAVLLTGLGGCSYLFYPHAKDFAEKAKGATDVETLINLTTMMEVSAKASKGGTGYDQPLNDLHNQFHASTTTSAASTRTSAISPPMRWP